MVVKNWGERQERVNLLLKWLREYPDQEKILWHTNVGSGIFHDYRAKDIHDQIIEGTDLGVSIVAAAGLVLQALYSE